jgi:hypothetical protein
MVPIGLVYSIHDATKEVAIQKMIDASKRMIDVLLTAPIVRKLVVTIS